jgi:hypothetical protein
VRMLDGESPECEVLSMYVHTYVQYSTLSTVHWRYGVWAAGAREQTYDTYLGFQMPSYEQRSGITKY